MNEKLVKFAVKTALGLIVSTAMGYAYKEEKKLQERIDNYYDEKNEVKQES